MFGDGAVDIVTSIQPHDLIPHRDPFLLVDKIVEMSDDRILASRYVDPDADFFKGHYPNEPVMPGVLICECCFQAGAILIANRVGGFDTSDKIPVLTRINDARFKRIVRPGETLDLEARIDEELDGAYFLTGYARVQGALCVRVNFACMLATKEGQGA